MSAQTSKRGAKMVALIRPVTKKSFGEVILFAIEGIHVWALEPIGTFGGGLTPGTRVD